MKTRVIISLWGETNYRLQAEMQGTSRNPIIRSEITTGSNYGKAKLKYPLNSLVVMGRWVIADVAQLVEQCFCKAKVIGSSPVIGSIVSNMLYLYIIMIRCGFLVKTRWLGSPPTTTPTMQGHGVTMNNKEVRKIQFGSYCKKNYREIRKKIKIRIEKDTGVRLK